MKRHNAFDNLWPILLLTLCAAGCRSARAEPAPGASAAPSGSAAADPSARQVYVPDLTQPPPPDEASPAPAKAEWANAPMAKEVRVTDPSCEVRRLREWYRIECNDAFVSLVGGLRDKVELSPGWKASMIFPARRGDVRVAVFSYFGKYGLVADAIVSEQWLEGDPAPLITVTGIPTGF